MPAILKIDGMEETLAKMASMPERLQKKLIRRAARPAAKEVAAAAKLAAPVLTGALEDSIKVRALRRSRRNKGIIGVSVRTSERDSMFSGDQFYGAFQEFGTERMDPNPFLIPAMLEKEGQVKQIFMAELRRIVEEEDTNSGGVKVAKLA